MKSKFSVIKFQKSNLVFQIERKELWREKQRIKKEYYK